MCIKPCFLWSRAQNVFGKYLQKFKNALALCGATSVGLLDCLTVWCGVGLESDLGFGRLKKFCYDYL